MRANMPSQEGRHKHGNNLMHWLPQALWMWKKVVRLLCAAAFVHSSLGEHGRTNQSKGFSSSVAPV